MGLKQAFTKQFELPTGSMGRLAAWLMSMSNKEKNQWLIDKLNIQPGDQVMEVGYGTGEVIDRLASLQDAGFIAGIDHSQLMYEIAARRNLVHRASNKVALHWGDVWGIPYSTDYFDIIFGGNVHFFWKRPSHEFDFLQRFLKPGGRLVMVFQPRWIRSERELIGEMERIREDYQAAGYKRIKMEVKAMKPVDCIYIEGTK
jgi:SAM-dependent methyltransferase